MTDKRRWPINGEPPRIKKQHETMKLQNEEVMLS